MKINFLHKPSLIMGFLATMSLGLSAQTGVSLSPKMHLRGPRTTTPLMTDNLRQKGLLPKTEPYSNIPNFQHYGDGGGETVTSNSVFELTGDNAIVDWVVVELRSPDAVTLPVATHAALLQRDGDVVGVDGFSPVEFQTVEPGQYHVIVRHRNHLGVMTESPLDLTSTPVLVDFTNPLLPLHGTKPCYDNGISRSLWLGDMNRDRKVIYQGPNNDIFSLFALVLSNPGNIYHNANYIVEGYLQADLNMDGQAIFNGPNNDRNFSFTQSGLNCGSINCIFSEQIP